jgi:hypothetical protein
MRASDVLVRSRIRFVQVYVCSARNVATAPPEIASIAFARQSKPRLRPEKQLRCDTAPSAGHDRRLAHLHRAATTRKTRRPQRIPLLGCIEERGVTPAS